MKWNEYRTGLSRGLPVGMGYFSVSFGFGAMAVSQGLRVFDATLISLTNVTSAGQFAGLTVIVAAATLWEMILTQLIINSRYALMSLALSQRMGQRIGFLPRLVIAFFNTDEVFAVASGQPGKVGRYYLFGLIVAPYIGWSSGTLLGSIASGLLPASVMAALGIAIYGMFLAIILPPARKEKPVRIVVLIAIAISLLFNYLPALKDVSSGFVVIICSVVAAAIGAVLFPVKDEEGGAAA